MPNNPIKYSKQVTEIADYIFANPEKIRKDILSHFVVKCRKDRRTVERYYKKAQEYNQTRIDKQEKARDEVLVEKAKEAIKSAIISRNEALEILSKIASGGGRKVEGELMIPTDSERVRAIGQMGKMQGWETPIKTAFTDSEGNDLDRPMTATEKQFLLDELNNDI